MRRIVLASLFLLACGDDDDPNVDTGGSTTTTATTSTSTTAGTSESGASGEASTTTSPAESSTSSAESSSSSTGDPCASASCGECFECTYDDLCADEHSACSIDPQCSIALICVRDCLEQSPDDPASCVAMCECPADGAFQTLLACATGVCVAADSCPALAC
ncbi:MAG TPA: hypothetical protein VG755_30850 [Nannocystaceae bacterium]|nr:hypothetical protein [Nannocystaceae bacterium]